MTKTALNSLNSNNSGYIYILSNPSMPGILKIGKTTRDIKIRADELFTTGVQSPFYIEFGIFVEDCHQFEKDIHNCFSGHRVTNNREFFTVDVDTAIVYMIDYYLDCTENKAENLIERESYFNSKEIRDKERAIKKKEEERVLTPEEILADEAEAEYHKKQMRIMLGLE